MRSSTEGVRAEQQYPDTEGGCLDSSLALRQPTGNNYMKHLCQAKCCPSVRCFSSCTSAALPQLATLLLRIKFDILFPPNLDCHQLAQRVIKSHASGHSLIS